jgi:hypothetical protein
MVSELLPPPSFLGLPDSGMLEWDCRLLEAQSAATPELQPRLLSTSASSVAAMSM